MDSRLPALAAQTAVAWCSALFACSAAVYLSGCLFCSPQELAPFVFDATDSAAAVSELVDAFSFAPVGPSWLDASAPLVSFQPIFGRVGSFVRLEVQSGRKGLRVPVNCQNPPLLPGHVSRQSPARRCLLSLHRRSPPHRLAVPFEVRALFPSDRPLACAL